jgi:hypothetical protein
MDTITDTTAALRIADLERELRFRDERIRELRNEVDEARDLVRRMEEQAQEHDEYLESFVTTFGMELDAEGCWRWGALVTDYNDNVDKFNALRDRYNKLVANFNRYALPPRSAGRPIAASTAQQEQVLRHHKAGRSPRWIAEEMTLSRRTVTTIIGKHSGTDRTSNKYRQRFGLEPKVKDWRPAARKSLPKRVAVHFEKGVELRKEAKGLK